VFEVVVVPSVVVTGEIDVDVSVEVTIVSVEDTLLEMLEDAD
jgi:hypothetical protein